MPTDYKVNYPYRWVIFPKISVKRGHFGAEEIVPHTEIQVRKTSHRKLRLLLPSNFHRNPHYCGSQKEDLEHKIKIADEMLRTYFEKGEGRGLNIKKSRKSYFDMDSIKKDTFSDKFILKNNQDYFSSFKEDFQKRHPWDDIPYQPKQESFIKGMEYDPISRKIDIDLETCKFTYSDYPLTVNPADPPADYPFMASPADPHAYFIDLNERKRRKNNLTIIVKSRANPICGAPKNELVAIETLREMITELEFRKYMIHGFILVRGLSGRVYQIFRDKDHTKVWEKGKLVEEVCVRLKRSLGVPPTDNVIAFRTMVLCSENEFRKLGNIYKMAA